MKVCFSWRAWVVSRSNWIVLQVGKWVLIASWAYPSDRAEATPEQDTQRSMLWLAMMSIREVTYG